MIWNKVEIENSLLLEGIRGARRLRRFFRRPFNLCHPQIAPL